MQIRSVCDWITEYSLIQSQTLRIFNFAFFSANFWWIFFRISRQIPEKSDAFCFFNQICENKLESCRNFWNLWELFTIIQNYSLVSLLIAHSRTVRPRSTSTRTRRPSIFLPAIQPPSTSSRPFLLQKKRGSGDHLCSVDSKGSTVALLVRSTHVALVLKLDESVPASFLDAVMRKYKNGS